MHRSPPAERRELREIRLACDLAVIGGGMAGVSAAVTAARAGIRVALVHDRPVLGGNASSEVRLWVLGATAHQHNNNRWAREGGVIDELLVENTYRNPEGNPLIFDTILLETVIKEANITLLLNTAVFDLHKSDSETIDSVSAFCSQNSTRYEIRAPLFCDASGDGIAAFLAGAAFRMGAESADEFGEKFAPDAAYGELLGHSLYFYSKDAGRPIQFTPPSYALDDIAQIPRFRHFNSRDYGCRLWWIELGGRRDTVHDTEEIKWELWKVVYGVWNYIKNSGRFPEAETLTLEWVGQIPGKRESRRFEGDYILRQQDIIEERRFDDAIAYGGWSIDLHPADGVFSERPGCDQQHPKTIYPIPYRCLYSRNIVNLFLAGRIISASHVAFGSTRVMATCAYAAQAAGMAAALCRERNLLPREVGRPPHLPGLQNALMRTGQHIPDMCLNDPDDLAQTAQITASSYLRRIHLSADGRTISLETHRAQMLPLEPGQAPAITVFIDAMRETMLTAELRVCRRMDGHTPDVVLDRLTIALPPGARQAVVLNFAAKIERSGYVFICLMRNDDAAVHLSDQRATGLLSLAYDHDQTPAGDIGVEAFEFWIPTRRPLGHNLACSVEGDTALFMPQNIANGLQRPAAAPNAWVAAPDDAAPSLMLHWDTPQTIRRIELAFDTDFDHAMESVLRGHPERAMPFCVKDYRILDETRNCIAERSGNYQTRNTLLFDTSVETRTLTIEITAMQGVAPAAVFAVRAYAQ